MSCWGAGLPPQRSRSVGIDGSERPLPLFPTRRKSAIFPPIIRLKCQKLCQDRFDRHSLMVVVVMELAVAGPTVRSLVRRTSDPCVPNPVIAPYSIELFPFVPDVAGVIPGLAFNLELGFRTRIRRLRDHHAAVLIEFIRLMAPTPRPLRRYLGSSRSFEHCSLALLM
jgi:hypothetical protein